MIYKAGIKAIWHLIKKYKKQANLLVFCLNYANIINKAPISGLEGTVGINQACNVFRKDEVIESFETEELLQNAKEQQQGMFKIPKVIN